MSKKKIAIIVVVVVIMLVLIGFGAYSVLADDVPANVSITGECKESLTLAATDGKIFDLGNAGLYPGCLYKSTVSLNNIGDRALDITLSSVRNRTGDEELLDYISLTVAKTDGTELYNGPIRAAEKPMFEPITIQKNTPVTLVVSIGLAKDVPNTMQGKKLDAEWVFEAKASVKTNSGGGGGATATTATTPGESTGTNKPVVDPAVAQSILDAFPVKTIYADDNNHLAYIIGYEDGTFHPDNNITRAETAVALSRILEITKTDVEAKNFTDLDIDSWCYGDVENMSSAGAIEGYEDKTFQPNNPITREEFVAMLIRLGKVLPESTLTFTDVKEDSWSSDYIYTAYTAGLIDGYEDGTFRPHNPITRAEAIKILNGVLQRSDFATVSNPFPDLYAEHWAYKYILEAAVNHAVK